MGFVDHDQVEVSDAEFAFGAVGLVDQAHHGGIGGEVDATGGVFFGDEVDRAGIGEVLFEGVGGLVDEGNSIGKEKDALDPVAALEEVAEGDDGARFAGASGHDEEGLAVFVFLEGVADFTDGTGLIVASSDRVVDVGATEGDAGGAALNHQSEFGRF